MKSKAHVEQIEWSYFSDIIVFLLFGYISPPAVLQ